MNARNLVGIALLVVGVAGALIGVGALSRGYSVLGSASGGSAIFFLALAWRALVDRATPEAAPAPAPAENGAEQG
jgi:hypothetical protein